MTGRTSMHDALTHLKSAVVALVEEIRRSAPGHRDLPPPAKPPAFIQRVHVNVTPHLSTATGSGGAMEAGPVRPSLQDDFQEHLDRVRALCASTGLELVQWQEDRLRAEAIAKAAADARSILPWPCRNYGHEPMATNAQRCYSGCDLSDSTAQG